MIIILFPNYCVENKTGRNNEFKINRQFQVGLNRERPIAFTYQRKSYNSYHLIPNNLLNNFIKHQILPQNISHFFLNYDLFWKNLKTYFRRKT